MDERDKRYEQRFKAQQIALKEATKELKGRLSLLNELRSNVATKDEVEALRERVTEISGRVYTADGTVTGKSASWVAITALAGLVIAAVAVVVHYLK